MTSSGAKELSDTHARADQVQLGLLRRMSPQRRLELTFAFSAEIINLSRRELEHRLGNSLEARLEWMRLNYGQELTQRFREALRQRGTAS
jgi:hypothetical protein